MELLFNIKYNIHRYTVTKKYKFQESFVVNLE